MRQPHWHFVWSTLAFVGGIVGGLGVALLLQQFAVISLTLSMFFVGALVGAVIGALLPSLIYAFVLVGQHSVEDSA